MNSSAGNPTTGLVEALPPLRRLALAYAQGAAKQPFLALFALDVRLAGIVRNSREPALAQLRLAWWREQLAQNDWPKGEPLLSVLHSWRGEHGALLPLVNAWELLTGDAPLSADAFESLAEARGTAFSALAELLAPSARFEALRMGRNWALADLAGHLTHPDERETVIEMGRAQDWRFVRLPRAMRPLAILHGVAARNLGNARESEALSLPGLFSAMRIGLIGR